MNCCHQTLGFYPLFVNKGYGVAKWEGQFCTTLVPKVKINFPPQTHSWSTSVGWVSMILLKRYKPVYIKTSRKILITTPKVHFSNKHPITALKILLCVPLWAGGS